LIKGKLTQKEFLQHVQTVAIAQLEEGDELIMTVEVLEPEPMKIRKTTIDNRWPKKPTMALKLIRKNQSPRLSGDTGRYSRNKKPVSYHPIDLGPQIELTPNAPNVINSKVYPLSPNEQKVLNEYLEDNLEKGYIVASSSRYGSPTFTVKKKDRTLRIVHDYRRFKRIYGYGCYPTPPHLFHPGRTKRQGPL